MQYAIQVPTPCHEQWDKMTPTDNGRHCVQCCKTVIDFTNWEREDILAYLQQHAATGTCGRFRSEQLDTPINQEQFVSSVSHSPLPLYKKIAAIFLFAFGLIQTSYNATAQTKQPTQQHAQNAAQRQHILIGKPAAPRKTDTPHKKPVKKVHKHNRVMGGPAIIAPDPESATITGGAAYIVPKPEHLIGDVGVMKQADTATGNKTQKR